MISEEQKSFFFGRKKFKFTDNPSIHLVVEFNGEWETTLDFESPVGVTVETNRIDMWSVGVKRTWNYLPSYWEDVEMKYIPTQEGDREDDI